MYLYNNKINAIVNPRSLPSTTLRTLNAFLLYSHNIPEVKLYFHFIDQETETKLAWEEHKNIKEALTQPAISSSVLIGRQPIREFTV